MATEVDEAYFEWSDQELSGCDAFQEVSVSQMLDHGSISFGRFEVESLSWEKKSVFTRNRRQEELEKCSTHGLVAEKKAYFEEYYKRILAVKSLEHNQQSEVTMNYGDDVNISSQLGEENKTAAELKYHGHGAVNIGNDHLEDSPTGVSIFHGHLEEPSTGVALEKATHPSEALQDSCLDMQPSLSSSRKSFGEIKEDSFSDYALQIQHLVPKLMKDEACIRSEGSIDHHDISILDDKRASDRNADLSSNDKPPIAAKATAPFAINPKPEKSKLTQVEDPGRDKTSQSTKTYKKESKPVPKLKNPSPIINNLSLSCKRKLDLKPSNGLNTAQRTIGKAENSTSRNAATDELSSIYLSTSVSSHKPITERCAKVTIPRPFSFATEKRAAAPSHLGDGTPRFTSKSSNRAVPSLTHEKNITLVQSTSEKATTADGAKGRILQNKRGYEKRMPLVSDSKHTGLRGKDATMLGSSKARSINFPRVDKSDSYSGKDQAKLTPKIHGIGSRKLTAVFIGNLKEDNRKILQWQTSNLSLNISKAHSNNLSLNAKKSRQEMPHWK